MNRDADTILDFWFGGAAGGDADALQAAFKRWFGGGDEFDREIRQRFGDSVERALAGGCSDWEQEARSRLALVLLVDQFPRNIFRGTARAFSGDERALRLARDAVGQGMHDALTPVERVFLFMPYQHAEDKEVQRESVALFADLLREEVPDHVRKLLESSHDYALRHRDIVERFGRFPYRNEALGRESTPEEHAWLAESNVRFGQ